MHSFHECCLIKNKNFLICNTKQSNSSSAAQWSEYNVCEHVTSQSHSQKGNYGQKYRFTNDTKDTVIILNSSLTFYQILQLPHFSWVIWECPKKQHLDITDTALLCKPFICHLTSTLTILYVLKDSTALDVGRPYKQHIFLLFSLILQSAEITNQWSKAQFKDKML